MHLNSNAQLCHIYADIHPACPSACRAEVTRIIKVINHSSHIHAAVYDYCICIPSDSVSCLLLISDDISKPFVCSHSESSEMCPCHCNLFNSQQHVTPADCKFECKVNTNCYVAPVTFTLYSPL